jgi:hypothetical protein
MGQTITIVAVPGQQINQNLPATSRIAAIDLGNGTPFDLTYSGFGCPDQMIIEAGLKVRLYHEVLDTGKVSILPVNNVGVSGTGIINITVYFVNDTIPKGTYPVPIPVQIVSAKVSSVITLSNEGGAVGTEVIDIGTAANNKLVDIFNNHFTWSVEQAGVAHTVLQGKSSGNPLQIGQNGDITELLGNWLVDGTETVTSTLTANGGVNVTTIRDNTAGAPQITLSNASPQVTVTNNESVAGTLTVTGDITANGAGTGLTVTNNELVSGTLTVTGLLTANGKVNTSEVDSPAATDFVVNVPTNQSVRLRVNGVDKFIMNSSGGVTCDSVTVTGVAGITFQAGVLTRFTGFSGTGSGTFNTNLGAVPSRLAFNPCTVSGSSQTIGGTEAQSSVVTTGAGLAWGGTAWKNS